MLKFGVKKIAALFGIASVISLFFIPLSFVLAQNQYEYTPLAPLPGTLEDYDHCYGNEVGPPSGNCQTTLEKYVPGMFRLLIGVAAALAVIMIIIGGIEYIGSESLWGKQEGKEKITRSLGGLFLAIFAWLLLYTISPDLLEFNLNIPVPEQTGGQTATSTSPGVPHCFAIHLQGYNTFIQNICMGNLSSCENKRTTWENGDPQAIISPGQCGLESQIVSACSGCQIIYHGNGGPENGMEERCFIVQAKVGAKNYNIEANCYRYEGIPADGEDPPAGSCLAERENYNFERELYAKECKPKPL